jgi:lysozyme
MMKTSNEGIALIKKWEGLKLNAYLDPIGIPTIGYGHTKNVQMGDTITQAEADALLRSDLAEFEGYVNSLVKQPLTQNQFDALVSFTYNLGPGNLQRSTLLSKVNQDPKQDTIPPEFLKWNKADGRVFAGLTNRRKDEAALYQSSKKKMLIPLIALFAAGILVLLVWMKTKK